MNIEQARFNMIQQQIRPWGVLDEYVLELLGQVPREKFVPEEYSALAFADMMIPLGHGQVMLTPKEEAQIIQVLKIKPTDKVLEVGTGSGYLTALLAKQAQHVYSVDIFSDFTTKVRHALDALSIKNATLITADAATGWEQHQPYEVIAITGALPFLPTSFRKSLGLGGRLFALLGKSPVVVATLITRTEAEKWSEQKLFETDVPQLVNAMQLPQFNF